MCPLHSTFASTKQAIRRLGLGFSLQGLAKLPAFPELLNQAGQMTCRLWDTNAQAAQAAAAAHAAPSSVPDVLLEWLETAEVRASGCPMV